MNNNPLTLEILCAYLPHDTPVEHTSYYPEGGRKRIVFIESISKECVTFSEGCDWYFDDALPECHFKLLLRPMSDMDKPLEELGGKSTFRVINDMLPKGAAFPIRTNNNWIGLMVFMPYVDCPQVSIDWPTIEKIRSLLLSLKFDLHGGLESGWALDLNTYGK
jgi:hypothetical protein